MAGEMKTYIIQFSSFSFQAYAGSSAGPKVNSSALLHAAKKNDYERVKILFRYGYRLERIDRITDPLKRIELFKESDHN